MILILWVFFHLEMEIVAFSHFKPFYCSLAFVLSALFYDSVSFYTMLYL